MLYKDIYTYDQLINLISEDDSINDDIVIRGNSIKTLGRLKRVYGTLGITSNSLIDLGSLEYVQDLWLSSADKLTSLGKLNTIEGNANLRYSKLVSLGSLRRVKGKLSLRDTEVTNLSNLEYVGELYLPARLKKLNFDFIETKKGVRFWKDLISFEKPELKSVGGENQWFNINVDLSKNNYAVRLGVYKTPNDPNEKYYKSKDQIKTENDRFNLYKKYLELDSSYLEGFRDSYQISQFYNRLNFEQVKSLKNNTISEEEFVSSTKHINKCFSNFSLNKDDFKEFYYLKGEYATLRDLIVNCDVNTTFSEIHKLELKLKRRILNGRLLLKQVVKESELNGFIVKNIKEFYGYLDSKLDEIYSDNYSFYFSLFGDIKTIDGVNSLFPKKFILSDDLTLNQKQKTTIEANKYYKSNIDKPPFAKYIAVKNKFDLGYDVSKLFNGGRLWLSHNESLLSYFKNNSNCFFYFIENVIHEIFLYLVLNLQNDFRVYKGVPRIGEGWVSETELFNLLKNEFDGFKVVQHGRPKWLGRQHIDIWFPEHNLGIEYQGRQHYEAIDYFGGEEAFLQNQERDKRKKQLCKENGALLFEVTRGYDFNKLVEKINKVINKSSSN
ncbi:hypothetical protein [Winogradskyella sp. A2]|uniref:hypothetical protein n=1 Tax=Winogradskyella sp. A2 TaxID=3366944 RepID=UPI00398C7555